MDQKILQGPLVIIDESYGGLGAHYLHCLYTNLNKIHQVDTVTGVTETNGSVRSRAIQVATEMRRFGIQENDVVLICSRCHADQTIAVLATLLIGAVGAPLDPTLNHKDCLDLVKQLKPKLCFCDLRPLKQIERVVQEIGMNSKLVHFGDQQSYATSFQSMLTYKQPQTFVPVYVENPRKRVAFVVPTQGTTNLPKLVCISHHFVFSQTKIYLQALSNPVKVISFYPLSTIMQVTLTCLCFEVSLIRILTGAFTERGACKFIQDLKVDYAFLSTEVALKLVDHVAVRDFNMSCLKCIVIGSLTTTIQDIKKLVSRLPRVKFTQMYITTETGSVTICQPSDYAESLEKIGTVGKVVQNCVIRVVDLETRQDVDPECPGELLVGGDSLMLGYFKNLQQTKSAMEGDFYRTGDVAKYDGDGWVYIDGRIADFILVDDLKMSPCELEAVITMHPYVKDAAVIGNMKEVVACVIIRTGTKLDEEKLMTFISEKLPVQKWPSRIIFLTSFPTTSIGKIKKDVLRDEYLKIKIEHSESMGHISQPQMEIQPLCFL